MPDEGANVPIFEAWKKYEEIAMHFNDLLMKIRTQAVAVVATLSTLIGIISRGADGDTNWMLLIVAFSLLCIVWIAIWSVDFCYYNRLLVGAVFGLLEIEEQSKTSNTLNEIQLSTRIEQAVANDLPEDEGTKRKPRIDKGRWFFYSLVMFALLSVLSLCSIMAIRSYINAEAAEASSGSAEIVADPGDGITGLISVISGLSPDDSDRCLNHDAARIPG